MDRRHLLLATGALATATLAGCLSDDGTEPDDTADDGIDNPSGEPRARPDIPEAELSALAADNAAFGMELYRRLGAEDADNLFLSPYSISVALAMTYAGARGETATQMEETLRFTDGQHVHPIFGALQHELTAREETEDQVMGADEEPESVDAFKLRIANALWGREGEQFAEAFVELVADYYGAGLAEADFMGDPEGERERINGWVADQTEERITELLPPGSIDANTVLVLTNAIYFLASWQSEFDPADTAEETFHTLDDGESSVPFMYQNLRTPYAALDDLEALELPYVGEEVSMVLILPQADAFEAVESSLDGDRLLEIFDALGDYTGDLYLPNFEVETEFALSEVLMDLGMEIPFGDGADFSGMFEHGGAGVFIDDVYHDAFVTIDEEGTEAAAATAVVMSESAPPDWGELRFDRPFIFCIRDRPTNSVLFLGRITDPA